VKQDITHTLTPHSELTCHVLLVILLLILSSGWLECRWALPRRPGQAAGARLGAPAVLVQQNVEHVDGGVGVAVPHP
jgi:hypothetical protein